MSIERPVERSRGRQRPFLGGWVTDILLGWLIGSVVGFFALDIVTSFAGANDQQHNSAQTVGAVVGIWWMRRANRPRHEAPDSDERTLRCASCGAEYIDGTVLCPECMGTDLQPIAAAKPLVGGHSIYFGIGVLVLVLVGSFLSLHHGSSGNSSSNAASGGSQDTFPLPEVGSCIEDSSPPHPTACGGPMALKVLAVAPFAQLCPTGTTEYVLWSGPPLTAGKAKLLNDHYLCLGPPG